MMTDSNKTLSAFKPNVVYDTDYDDIIKDFYDKALPLAHIYKRAVGYFSASSIMLAVQGLFRFIHNDGKMQLIIGSPLSREEFDAIDENKKKLFLSQCCAETLNRIYYECTSKVLKAGIELLSYLVYNGNLEIKFALKNNGMYHEKIGVLISQDGRKISFGGSANETGSALSGDVNSESIMVFSDIDAEIYAKYGIQIELKFDALWNNNIKSIKVVGATPEFISSMKEYSKGKDINYFNDLFSKFHADSDFIDVENNLEPKIPLFINGQPYILKGHQENAIKEWQNNSFKGIFSMATGSGKTITALHAATKLFQNINKSLFFIVAVPYQALAEQWRKEMSRYNIFPLVCGFSKNNWKFQLKRIVASTTLAKNKKFNAIIVINATLKSEDFQFELNKMNLNAMLFICDECHHHGSLKMNGVIPEAQFKIGLSATPWEDYYSDSAVFLRNIYGQPIAKYDLEDALKDNVLCPYKYKIIYCEMDDKEVESYLNISRLISVFESKREKGITIDESQLLHLLLRRTRMLGAIKSKYSKLDKILKKEGIKPKSLFYCGEGSDFSEEVNEEYGSTQIIDKVTRTLAKYGYKNARFTSEQTSSQREEYLEAFKNGTLDSLVAKRVLDEGIDIPDCRYAFILASANSTRQYIQRRGRILRKSSGKEFAVIYDFVVSPPSDRNSQALESLIKREEARIHEFSRLALNTEIIDV
ncbi:DEAD/DEAH box helicase family protein [Enterobacter ludwigii]|uniref:DEAD/DEAH box helicase family protein n=1 Tax=Enterobacter ludwigii TaxID=299767 RepID=UPI0039755CCF